MGMPANFAEFLIYDDDAPPLVGRYVTPGLDDRKKMEVGTAADIAALTGLTLEQLWQAIGDGQPVGDPPIVYNYKYPRKSSNAAETPVELPVNGQMPDHAGGGLARDVNPPVGDVDSYDGRPVEEVDSGGKLVRRWDSIDELLDDVALSKARLLEAIRGNLMLLGFYYRFVEAVQRDDDEDVARVEKKKPREIGYMPAPAIPPHLVDDAPRRRKLKTKPSLSPGDGVPARAEVPPSPEPSERISMPHVKVTSPEGQVTECASVAEAKAHSGVSDPLIYGYLKSGGGEVKRGDKQGWRFDPIGGTAAPMPEKKSKLKGRVAKPRGEKLPVPTPARPAAEVMLRGKPSDALLLAQAEAPAPTQKSSLRVLFVELSGDDQTLASALKLLDNKFAARAVV